MYNDLQFIITSSPLIIGKKINTDIFKSPSFCILPYPSHIENFNDICIISNKITVSIYNINPSNELIQQFISELKEDFNISIEFNEKIDDSVLNHVSKLNFSASQEEEGYKLSIYDNLVILKSITLHGLFNAFQSFRQILDTSQFISNDNEKYWLIPSLEITDWPTLKIRGISDDISRGNIPTIEFFKEIICKISRFKNNFYAIYIEDVFRCSKHPNIGKNYSQITPEEIIEVDKYAKSRFVTFIPIFQTLGHFDNILSIPEYYSLGEFPSSHCLSVANGNIYPFLKDFIEEINPCFSSKFFHIGLNDFYDLGYGNSKELINAIGIENALKDHIRKIRNLVNETGKKRIIIYDDLIIKYPQILNILPKDIIIMISEKNFDKKISKIDNIVKLGFSIIFNPTMKSTCRHFPDYESAKNIFLKMNKIAKIIERESYLSFENEFSDGKEIVLGQVINCWGDYSNHNLRENNIYGSILSGTISWNSDNFIFNKFIKDMSWVFYGLDKKFDNDMFLKIFAYMIIINRLIPKFKKNLEINFFDYFYQNSFEKSSNFPQNKSHNQIIHISEDILNTMSLIQQKSRRNTKYLQFLEFSALISKNLGIKEKLRLDFNNYFDKIGKLNLDQRNHYAEKLFIEISNLKTETLTLFDLYKSICMKSSKRPYIKYNFERFDNLILQYNIKKEELMKENHYIPQFLPSFFLWTKNKKSESKTRYFKKEFKIHTEVDFAKVQIIAGSIAKLYINGEYLGDTISRYSKSLKALKNSIQVFDISSYLHKGNNIIGIEANNFLHSNGYINVYLEYKEKLNNLQMIHRTLISDDTWLFSLNILDDLSWSNPENSNNEIKWNKVYCYGMSPKEFGILYRPSLLTGGKSIHQDDFGYDEESFFLKRY